MTFDKKTDDFETDINLKMMASGLPPATMIVVALRLAASTIVACTMRECGAGGPLDDMQIDSTVRGMLPLLDREIRDCASRLNELARAALIFPEGPEPQ